MTVYNTAYDTTACSVYNTKKIVDQIAEARLRDWVPASDGLLLIQSSKGVQGQVPAFNHPVYIGTHGAEHLRVSAELQLDAFIAIDVRPAGRMEINPGEGAVLGSGKYKVVNETIYKSRMYRGGLTKLWIAQGSKMLRNMAPVALPIYATWLTEAMSFRWQLDPKTKYDLLILAGLFYMSNHVSGLEFENSDTERRMLAWVAHGLKLHLPDVLDMYKKSGIITSTADFCAKAIAITDNIRLKELNAGVLIATVGSTWNGDNKVENLAVALEHPPTWIGICLEAYTNKMLRQATISSICERRQFQEGLKQLLQNAKTEMKAIFDVFDHGIV